VLLASQSDDPKDPALAAIAAGVERFNQVWRARLSVKDVAQGDADVVRLRRKLRDLRDLEAAVREETIKRQVAIPKDVAAYAAVRGKIQQYAAKLDRTAADADALLAKVKGPAGAWARDDTMLTMFVRELKKDIGEAGATYAQFQAEALAGPRLQRAREALRAGRDALPSGETPPIDPALQEEFTTLQETFLWGAGPPPDAPAYRGYVAAYQWWPLNSRRSRRPAGPRWRSRRPSRCPRRPPPPPRASRPAGPWTSGSTPSGRGRQGVGRGGREGAVGRPAVGPRGAGGVPARDGAAGGPGPTVRRDRPGPRRDAPVVRAVRRRRGQGGNRPGARWPETRRPATDRVGDGPGDRRQYDPSAAKGPLAVWRAASARLASVLPAADAAGSAAAAPAEPVLEAKALRDRLDATRSKAVDPYLAVYANYWCDLAVKARTVPPTAWKPTTPRPRTGRPSPPNCPTARAANAALNAIRRVVADALTDVDIPPAEAARVRAEWPPPSRPTTRSRSGRRPRSGWPSGPSSR
jgi:hypothetical protein